MTLATLVRRRAVSAFAIVASSGNIYSGLWYPIVVAAMGFVVGLIFLAETKDQTSRKSSG